MTGSPFLLLLLPMVLAPLTYLAMKPGSSSRLASRLRGFAVPLVPAGEEPAPREVRQRRAVFSVLLLACLCGAAVLHRFDPTPHPGEGHVYPVCLFHKYTGLYCPGCGTTRALHALVHGRLGTAVRYNQLTMLIGVPVLGWALLRYGIRAAFPRVRVPTAGSMHLSQTIGVIAILFSVLRNVPYAPFTYLAPPEPAKAATAPPQPKASGQAVGRGSIGAELPVGPPGPVGRSREKEGAAPSDAAPG